MSHEKMITPATPRIKCIIDRLAKTPIFRKAVSLDRSKKCGGMVRIDGDRQ